MDSRDGWACGLGLDWTALSTEKEGEGPQTGGKQGVMGKARFAWAEWVFCVVVLGVRDACANEVRELGVYGWDHGWML